MARQTRPSATVRVPCANTVVNGAGREGSGANAERNRVVRFELLEHLNFR